MALRVLGLMIGLKQDSRAIAKTTYDKSHHLFYMFTDRQYDTDGRVLVWRQGGKVVLVGDVWTRFHHR